MPLFGKRKKKREVVEENSTISDALVDQRRKIDEELLKLEYARAEGRISDAEYLEMRERLEKIKRDMEEMASHSPI